MKVQEFKQGLATLNYVLFDDDTLLLFNDLELYDRNTETSVKFNSFDELLTYKHNGLTMAERIEAKKDFRIYINGGRGTGSGKSTSLFGGQEGNATGRDNSTPDLPARMNRMYNGNQMSAAHTLETFRNEHATSKTEHLIAHDDDGFVSVYTHGGKSSVGFTPDQVEGKHVIHNHPNGSNFSKADLDNLAATGQKSIAATSKSVTYKVEKNKNFDAKGFAKSLNNAKTTQTDYNKAVGDFLKRNQKKYGYTYTETYHDN